MTDAGPLPTPPYRRPWGLLAGLFVGFCGVGCATVLGGVALVGRDNHRWEYGALALGELATAIVLVLILRTRRWRGFGRGVVVGACLPLLLGAACWGIATFNR